MFVYLFVAITTCCLSYLGTISKNKHINAICFCLIVFSFSFIAGARDFSVGTDLIHYGEPLFKWICAHSMDDVFNKNIQMKMEPLYMIMVFLISRITDNVFWDYFFTEFVIAFFFCLALEKSHLGKFKWLGIFIYNAMFFSYSLNLMRQMMAISILTFGFSYVMERKLFKFTIIVLVATGFHNSGLLGFAFYPLFSILGLKKSETKNLKNNFMFKYRTIMLVIISFSFILSIVFIRELLQLFVMIKPSYQEQISNLRQFDTSWAFLILMNLVLLPFIIFKVWRFHNIELFFFFSLLVLATIGWQLQGVSNEMFRVVLHFWALSAIVIPYFLNSLRSAVNQRLLVGYYLLLGSVYHVYIFIIALTNETYPYSSKMLGI